jgi:pimeloyl-ACP methyl ester carboxylesterase
MTTTTTSRSLRRPGGQLAYDVTEPAGSLASAGRLVVASPGLGDVRQSYRFLVADLVAAGHRVATVDLRGHGGSSVGWPDYSEAAVAQDLLALIEELAPSGDAVLIGNSYSGGAAVLAAARQPGLVSGLVLAGAFVRTVPQGALQRMSTWLISHTPIGRPLWNAYYPSLYPGAKPSDFDTYRAALKANLAEPGRFAAVAAMAAADHDAAEAALPVVTAPALVVMGTKDPDFPDPVAEAQLTADRLGGPAEVVLVEGAGHYPHAERPDVVSPAVVRFLARHAGGR